jgi:hypothetical protein
VLKGEEKNVCRQIVVGEEPEGLIGNVEGQEKIKRKNKRKRKQKKKSKRVRKK